MFITDDEFYIVKILFLKNMKVATALHHPKKKKNTVYMYMKDNFYQLIDTNVNWF